MVKVSVIVPVYNVEAYIRKCLETLVNQTLKEIEIIIIDDGSTDKSAIIVKEFQEKYPNIQYYKKENGGLGDARNYGLQYVNGQYIAFLDSDDYIANNTYQLMYEKAKKEKSDMVECNFYWVYEKRKKEDIGEKYLGKKEMFEKARVVAWNKLFKKELLEQANIIFPKGLQYEDVAFFYQLIPYINRVSFVKEPLIYYVQRKNSISNQQNEKTADIFEVLEKVIQYYKDNDLYEEYKEVIEYTVSRLLLCSSFKRMAKIKNKHTRKRLLNETWTRLNTSFPKWKENAILNTKLDNKKRYLLSINRVSYRVYANIFRIK